MYLSPQQILIIAVFAAVGCGLMAGLFFAFSNFVMKALLHQPTESGVRTMQSISAFIQNPIFFVLFWHQPGCRHPGDHRGVPAL